MTNVNNGGITAGDTSNTSASCGNDHIPLELCLTIRINPCIKEDKMFVPMDRTKNPQAVVECFFCAYKETLPITADYVTAKWGVSLSGSWKEVNYNPWCGGCDPRK